jgi:hypothetical protein
MMTVTKFRLLVKSQWLGSLAFAGEECEVFVQEGAWLQVYVVASCDLLDEERQQIPLLFHTIVEKR